MKNLRDFLIVVAVGATLLFPSQSDGELFKRFKARKERRQAATVQYTSTTQCTTPNCTIHPKTGTGQLRINRKGGFEGQLTDDNYADYIAKQTGAKTPTPAELPEVLELPEKPVEVSIVVEQVSTEADAQAVVKAAETALAKANEAAERAAVEKQRADKKLRLDLQNEIEDVRADMASRIDALTARLEALQPAKTD